MSDLSFEIGIPYEVAGYHKDARLTLSVKDIDMLSEEQRKHIMSLMEWAVTEIKTKEVI